MNLFLSLCCLACLLPYGIAFVDLCLGDGDNAPGEVKEAAGFGLGFHWVLGFKNMLNRTSSFDDSGQSGHCAPLTTTPARINALPSGSARAGGEWPSRTAISTPKSGPLPKACPHITCSGFMPDASITSRSCFEKFADSVSVVVQKSLRCVVCCAKGLRALMMLFLCASERLRPGGFTTVTDWFKFPVTFPVLLMSA